MLQAFDLRCEYRTNPLGIFTVKPRSNWKIESDRQNIAQTAYSVELAAEKTFGDPLWRSGKTASLQSLLVQYAGPSLAKPTTPGLNSPAGTNRDLRKVPGKPAGYKIVFIENHISL
jgi:hypothetical protein